MEIARTGDFRVYFQAVLFSAVPSDSFKARASEALLPQWTGSSCEPTHWGHRELQVQLPSDWGQFVGWARPRVTEIGFTQAINNLHT